MNISDFIKDVVAITDATAREVNDLKLQGEKVDELRVSDIAFLKLNEAVTKSIESDLFPKIQEAVLMHRMFNGDYVAGNGGWVEGLARALEPVFEPYSLLIDDVNSTAAALAAGDTKLLNVGKADNLATSMTVNFFFNTGLFIDRGRALSEAGLSIDSLLRATGVKSELEEANAERAEFEARQEDIKEQRDARFAPGRAERSAAEVLMFVVDHVDQRVQHGGLLLEGLYERLKENKPIILLDKHKEAIANQTQDYLEDPLRWIVTKVEERAFKRAQQGKALEEFIDAEAPTLAALVDSESKGLDAIDKAEKPARKTRKKDKALSDDTIALTFIRNSSGITDGELCEMIGVARPTLTKYTKGAASITLDEESKIKLIELASRNIAELEEAIRLMGGNVTDTPVPESLDDFR